MEERGEGREREKTKTIILSQHLRFEAKLALESRSGEPPKRASSGEG